MQTLRPFCEAVMKTFSAILFAASFIAVAAAHAAKPSTTEVHGVKLISICNLCGVVSDVRVETVKGKGSGQGAVDEAAASGASAGSATSKSGKKVWFTTIVFKGGTTQTYQQTRNPGFKPGDVVTVQEGIPMKYIN
jgi:hypothetical protein